MQKIYKNIITALILLLLPLAGVFAAAEVAQAQEGLELTVSPPISYLKVAPGTKQNHTISLKNNGPAAITATPQILDFSVDGKTGQPVLRDQHTFPYFTMPAASLKPVVLEPGQVAQLQIVIEAPATAPDKEYPLSIVFSSENTSSLPQEPDAGRARVTGAVASNLIVLVSDKTSLEKKLVVSDFGAPTLLDSFRGFSAEPILENERFSAAAASGSAKLVSWTGTTVSEYQIYPDNILGFSSRPIRALDPDSEAPQAITFTFKPNFMIGPYSLVVELDNDGQTEVFSTTIIAFPFSILVAAAVGLVIGITYWWKTRRDNTLRI